MALCHFKPAKVKKERRERKEEEGGRWRL